MSIKTLTLMAAVIAGTLAFDGKAAAQVYYSSGYYTPGVVTTSYYAPAVGVGYSYPYTTYYGAPAYGTYYSTPYYGGAYTSAYYPGWRVGPLGRRWWWY